MPNINNYDQAFADAQSEFQREQEQRIRGTVTPAAAPAARPLNTPTRPNEAAKAAEQPQPEADLSFGDYAIDAVKGVGAGVEGFFKSVGKLGDDIVETLGGDLADDSVWENSIKTKTWAGSLTSGVTQFAMGFLPA